jgi:hypothetical protein
MLLVPAVILTLLGFVVWGAGILFDFSGLATIGAVMVVAVGAMILSDGLQQRDGTIERQVDTNTTEIEPQTTDVQFLPSFPLGLVWTLLGGVLLLRGVDPDA